MSALGKADAVFAAMIARDTAEYELAHTTGAGRKATSLGGYIAGIERAREVLRESAGVPVYDEDGVLVPFVPEHVVTRTQIGAYCSCRGWSLIALPNRAGEESVRLGFAEHVVEALS